MRAGPSVGRCVDSIPIPRNSKSEWNKYDVDALDALEMPRLGIELHFRWGLSNLAPKLPVPKTSPVPLNQIHRTIEPFHSLKKHPCIIVPLALSQVEPSMLRRRALPTPTEPVSSAAYP
jgi:hypothetical protein